MLPERIVRMGNENFIASGRVRKDNSKTNYEQPKRDKAMVIRSWFLRASCARKLHGDDQAVSRGRTAESGCGIALVI
jgi:hypothetical protein